MNKLIIATIVIALVSPAIVLAGHKKHKAPAQHNSSQPNLLGRVVHGTHGMRAKLSVRAHGSRHTSHPSVTSGGQFTMHLKPGTYTVWAKRRGAGKGHVAFHIDQGQTMNVTVPIFKHGRLLHRHQLHRLGVAHRSTRQTVAPKPTPKPTVVVPTPAKQTGRVANH